MSPEDTDGPPEVMPSNDWWKFGSQALDSVTKVALARAMQPAADSGYVSSNAKNPPPAGGASVIPGGAPRGARMTADGDVLAIGGVPVTWIVAGLVVAGFVFFFLKRHR